MNKKLIIISLITLISSCSHNLEQRVSLGFNFNELEAVVIERNHDIKVAVFDDRKKTDFIGKKCLGKEKITIISDSNLTQTLEKKLADGFKKKGFIIGDGKLVELHVNNLKYKAKRKFFIGKSSIKVEVQVVVKNSRNKQLFSKNYALSLENKHFIAPLKSTDVKTINFALKDVLNDILLDEGLILELKS